MILAILETKEHHARWINLDDNTVACSECGAIFNGMILSDFCPNCKVNMMEVDG